MPRGESRTYPWIGVNGSHHNVSHHQLDPGKLSDYAKINTYHVSLLAYFLERLRSTPDGDGTLLDNSIFSTAAASVMATVTTISICRS